jgi:hypothetical protein
MTWGLDRAEGVLRWEMDGEGGTGAMIVVASVAEERREEKGSFNWKCVNV